VSIARRLGAATGFRIRTGLERTKKGKRRSSLESRETTENYRNREGLQAKIFWKGVLGVLGKF